MDKKMISILGITEAAAFYILNLLSSEDLVTYACKAIEQGVNSDALSILAGELHPEMNVVGPLFERTLVELHISRPTKLIAQLTIAQFYAKAIKSGNMTPFDGARKIWWDISNEIDNPAPILLAFVGAASEIEDLPERYAGDKYDPTPHIEEYKKQIIESATKLLEIKDPSQLLDS